MAINRFMQPWKRDFSTAHYIPNFDAWAKVIGQKEENYGNLLANADKIASLIPEAGYALEDDRNQYLSEVKAKTSGIINMLHEKGNMTDARREISRLANDVSMNPRISAYKNDALLKPEVAKTMLSQTAASDVFVNNWFDPQTGKVKQTTWDKWNPSHYSTVETKDLHEPLLKLGDPLKPLWEKIKTFDKDLTVMTAPDGTTKYAIAGESGYKEFIDFNHLAKFLSPNGEFGDYAKAAYRNFSGDARAYWDAKYSGLSPEKKEQQFYKDLMSTNLIRIYSKEQTQDLLQPIGTGKKEGEGSDKSDVRALVTNQIDVVSKFDKLPETAGSFVQDYLNKKETLKTFGVKQVAEVNKQISQKLGGSDASTAPVIIRDTSTGKYAINQDYNNPSELYQITLNNTGLTPYDLVTKLNNEYTNLEHQAEVQEEILQELGLDDSKQQRLIQELQERAAKNAQDDIKERQGRHKARYGAYGMGQNPPVEKPTQEQIDREFSRLLANSEHKELQAINKRLQERRVKPFAHKANSYAPLKITTEDKTAIDGMSQALLGVATGSLQDARNPGTDEFYSTEQIGVLQKAMRERFGGKNTENLKIEDANNFEIFFDDEESKYKLMITVLNDNVANELKMEDGVIRVELPIDNMNIASSKGLMSIPQFLNIEGDPAIISDMRNISSQYNQTGAYRSLLKDEYDTKYHINANILQTNPEDSTVSYTFKTEFSDGGGIKLNISNPREGIILKKFVNQASQVINDTQNKESVRNSLDYLISQGQIPSMQGYDVQQKDEFLDRILGKNLGNLVPSNYFNIKEGVNTTLDRHLKRDFTRLAAEVSTLTGQKLNISSAHDEEREDPNSPYYNPGSQHINATAVDISYDPVEANAFKEILGIKEFVPKKYYNFPKDKYGPMRIMYEERKDKKGNIVKHFHIAKS